MQTGTGETESFRIGATVSVVIVWVKLLAYLRNVMIDFAVFVGGVFYVIRRLAAFLTALGIILIAFAQMFFTVYQQSDYCLYQPKNQPHASYMVGARSNSIAAIRLISLISDAISIFLSVICDFSWTT